MRSLNEEEHGTRSAQTVQRETRTNRQPVPSSHCRWIDRKKKRRQAPRERKKSSLAKKNNNQNILEFTPLFRQQPLQVPVHHSEAIEIRRALLSPISHKLLFQV
ncbi:hypothetical protein AVEN_92673-1 [Araneus ventricosus]|uniref:Uncharacterized protein n=1 Tax=Araneus ventricosus TaxID=182803 RepID=A0A4Y2T2C7_ARAVE|nr:hypothetical protein AVEN_92673-1 [Araneus ventricosus]